MTDLIEDAGRVVVGSVLSQREVVEQETLHTISTIEVQKEFQPRSLGVELHERARPENARGPLSAQRPGRGETIEIRQYGSATMQETVAPLLIAGETYLLFINLTGLEGAAASQYYITGSEAGIYRGAGGPRGFERVAKEPGDKLPELIKESELAP